MLITDPIGDMLTRIKNALTAKKQQVVIPHSKAKLALAEILKKNNYIQDFTIEEKKPQADLVVSLRYIDGLPAITGAERISKPGRRLYSKVNKIPVTLNGYGITIVSTSRGVMIDQEARKNNVGGELLCRVW